MKNIILKVKNDVDFNKFLFTKKLLSEICVNQNNKKEENFKSYEFNLECELDESLVLFITTYNKNHDYNLYKIIQKHIFMHAYLDIAYEKKPIHLIDIFKHKEIHKNLFLSEIYEFMQKIDDKYLFVHNLLKGIKKTFGVRTVKDDSLVNLINILLHDDLIVIKEMTLDDLDMMKIEFKYEEV